MRQFPIYSTVLKKEGGEEDISCNNLTIGLFKALETGSSVNYVSITKLYSKNENSYNFYKAYAAASKAVLKCLRKMYMLLAALML